MVLCMQSERLQKAWRREHTRFKHDYNDRLYNGLVLLLLVDILMFRFVIKFSLLETLGWVVFLFLQVSTCWLWPCMHSYFCSSVFRHNSCMCSAQQGSGNQVQRICIFEELNHLHRIAELYSAVQQHCCHFIGLGFAASEFGLCCLSFVLAILRPDLGTNQIQHEVMQLM